MGSTEHSDTDREVTVLVTGFGPFQDKFPVNPSFEITKSLPESLPAASLHDSAVRILPFEQPIRVCYDEVRELIPKLHTGYAGSVDLVLHIGMASGRKFYCAEKYGHRDGYIKNKDLDGKVLGPSDGIEQFGDCPSTMTTSLDYDNLFQDWRHSVENIPEGSAGHKAVVRQSEDAGHYLCDYTYFNSLAYFGRRCGKVEGGACTARPVLFLHVPAESDAETLDRGRAVTIELIRAMVRSFTAPATKQAGTA